MTEPEHLEQTRDETRTRGRLRPPMVRYLQRVFLIWLAAIVFFTVGEVGDPKVPSDWLRALLDSLVFATPFFVTVGAAWAVCSLNSVSFAVELVVTWIAFFAAALIAQSSFALLDDGSVNLKGAVWWGVTFYVLFFIHVYTRRVHAAA